MNLKNLKTKDKESPKGLGIFMKPQIKVRR